MRTVEDVKKSYFLTESNLTEVAERFNKFCEAGFYHTHDWMKFNDKKDKEITELLFEGKYPTYLFKMGARWEQREYFDGEKMLYLNAEKHKTLLLTIKLNTEIIFEDNQIYYIENISEEKKYVGKIYR